MSSLTFALICSDRYLPATRALARSLRAHHPEAGVVALLTDGGGNGAAEPFAALALDQVAFEATERLRFRYDPGQLVVASKPFLLANLARRADDVVVYVDSDVLVLAPLESLLAAARHATVVLVPHLVAPLAAGDAAAGRELAVLRAGAFNGGVLAVRGSDEGRRFLDWWCHRVAMHCQMEPERGVHGDQRWLDLVPGAFAGVHVLRDSRYDVAYWNLPEREVRWRDGRLQVDGAPSCLFHFSGYDPDDPLRVSRHDNRLTMSGIGAAAIAFAAYLEALDAAGWRAHRALHRGVHFDNGVAIPALARALYGRLADAEAAAFGDPFATAGAGSVYSWLRAAAAGDSLPRLWREVLRQRPDVRAAFRHPGGGDRAAFVEWARRSGGREHGIPDELLP